MGFFSKIKDSTHKRTETRNSIFSSNDSVASNTSSETSNFNHPPRHMKNLPASLKPALDKLPARPKSEYLHQKELPQEPAHSRSYSDQGNELPLLSTGGIELEETLQPEESFAEVTQQLINDSVTSSVYNSESPSPIKTEPPIQQAVEQDIPKVVDTNNQFLEQTLQPVTTQPVQEPQNTSFHYDVNQSFTYPNVTEQPKQMPPSPPKPASRVQFEQPSFTEQPHYHSPQLPSSAQNAPYYPTIRFGNYNTTVNDDDDDDEDDEDDSTDSSDYSTTSSEGESVSSGSTAAPTQHPYYEQWRRYYEALALQQQQFMNRQSMFHTNGYSGFNPMMFYGNPQMMQPQQMQMPPYFYNPYMMQGNNNMMNPQMSTEALAMMYQQMQLSQSQLPLPLHTQSQPNLPLQTEPKPSQPSSRRQSRTNTPAPMSKSNSFNNMSPESVSPHDTPNKPDYLSSYKKSRNLKSEKIEEEENELISNSRKSTIKSNRYASAPSEAHRKGRAASFDSRVRITSLESNFKPVEFKPYSEEDESLPGSRALSTTMDASVAQSSQSLAQLNLQDTQAALQRHISDYSKYLFDDDDDDEDDYSDENEQSQSALKNTEVSQVETVKTTVNHQLPTPNSDDGLSRKGTSASEASYSSIQSEGSAKFTVADPRRKSQPQVKPIPERNVKKKNKKTKKPKKSKPATHHSPQNHNHGFNPNMSITDLNLGSMIPPPPPPPGPLPPMAPFGNSTDQFMMMNYSNPLLSQSTEYEGSVSGNTGSAPRSRRQSITTTDSKRKSMMMEGSTPKANKRNSVPVFSTQQQQQHKQKQQPQAKPPPKVQDSTINKKIQEFVKLRSKIAAGNKTAEYRLHWVKMLITATNYRLYSYINIKGEAIQPEQQATNKAQFIKSSVTHISKLIKEFSSGVHETDGVKCEAFFLYANMLKQDYLMSYNQDFNMEKDIPKAIECYERVLSINEKDFKALFKLGEIYEYELNDLVKAVEYYTNAAKFGYNRAILKMAMMYLQVPEMRTIKYFKYLKNLSNIDLNEVHLDEEDYNEMEEVIGLACYELGKIFEGIYPGDLTTDDEFIEKSLELAPVNYAKSLTYYNKSAKLNCLLAQVRLGIVYERGELNRQQNPNKSIQWYIKASTSPLSFRRHPDAMVGLARWCLQGSDGTSKYIPTPVPDRAVMWCERAIEEFNAPQALYFMGELCDLGIAKGKSKNWYEKAYNLGNQEAGKKLGYM